MTGIPVTQPAGQGVLLLHGIGGAPLVLRRLELALRAQGYRVLNLAYPSRRLDLEAIAELIAPQVQAFADGLDGPLHIVTHSMGGLVARVLLARHRPAQMGRMVQLAPPLAGSEIADALHRQWLFKKALGPAGEQLITRNRQGWRATPTPKSVEVGIIAGSLCVSVLGWALLPRPNDGRVALWSTMDNAARDHIVVPATHTGLALHPRTIRQTLHFLRVGAFSRR